MKARLRQAASYALFGAAGFVALYVAYAHFASWRTSARYRELPTAASFASESDLTRSFTVRAEGGLTHALTGGELRVTGTSAAAGAHVELSSGVRSLEESVLSLRFKVATPGAYDVTLGLAAEHTGEGPQTIAYGLRNETAAPGYAWDGSALHAMPGLRGRGLPGEELGEKVRTPFTEPEAWHELTIHVSPSLHRISASVDGVPTGSFLSEWIAGTPVRLVFGVRAREPGQAVDVAIAEVTSTPRPGEAQALDWTDRFGGKVVDPRRWSIHSFRSEVLDVALVPSKAGLVATGRATSRVTDPSLAFLLDTPSFPMSSVYVRAVVEARSLDRAAFFVGVSSALGGAHLRFFDAGVHGKDREAMLSGHWGRDAQVRFSDTKERAASETFTLEIDIDAKTRVARAKLDGRLLGEHVTDLQPREHVRVRFGAVLDDAEGRFDFTVRELRVKALGD